MTPEQILDLAPPPARSKLRVGQILYEFIVKNHLSLGLELRSSPGITTVYLAGAIGTSKAGLLRSVCQRSSTSKGYDVHAALQKTGLSSLVSFYDDSPSYNWRLMRFLQEGMVESLDFCVIDGGKTWTGVGFACCLVEKLLKPGGWLILDNLDFSFRESKMRRNPRITRKSEEEQTIHQVRCVFELLIEQNPRFGIFRTRGPLAFAQKRGPDWTEELRSENKKQVAICNAIERARHDPEFREELLRSSRQALSSHDGTGFDDWNGMHFADTDELAPVVRDQSQRSPIVYLDQPSWEKRTSESELNELIERNKPHP